MYVSLPPKQKRRSPYAVFRTGIYYLHRKWPHISQRSWYKIWNDHLLLVWLITKTFFFHLFLFWLDVDIISNPVTYRLLLAGTKCFWFYKQQKAQVITKLPPSFIIWTHKKVQTIIWKGFWNLNKPQRFSSVIFNCLWKKTSRLTRWQEKTNLSSIPSV